VPGAPSARVANSSVSPAVPSAIDASWRRAIGSPSIQWLASSEKTGIVAKLTIAARPVGACAMPQNRSA
jgi:hypothetical protein